MSRSAKNKVFLKMLPVLIISLGKFEKVILFFYSLTLNVTYFIPQI
jgi:hypothetical protein